MPRPSLLFVLLVLFAGAWACDENPPAATAAAPAPPPQEVKFPANATHATYWFYDDLGERHVVRSRNEAPAAAQEFLGVSVGEKTPAVEGQIYRLDTERSDDRVAVATLLDEDQVRMEAAAAWSATDQAHGVWESSTVYCEVSDVPKSKRAKSRRATRDEPQFKEIEIVGVSDGWSGRSASRSSSRGSSKSQKGGQWKSVTFYTTRSCAECRRARTWMHANGVSFSERDVGNSRQSAARMATAARARKMDPEAVPTFVIGGTRAVMQGWDPDRFERLARR